MSLKATMTEKELEFMEHFHDPTSLTENLFPKNFDAPQKWSKNEKCLQIRPYQMAMQNYSYMYADDPLLSDAENFKKKKGAGDLYSIGSRNTGKSLFLIIDNVLTVMHACQQAVVASFDDYHLGKVIEPLASYIDTHPFMKIFRLRDSKKGTVTRKPFKVKTENGAIMFGVNEQIESPTPGIEYQGKHFFYHSYEEFSYATDAGLQNAIDAENSIGHIFRPSGIPDLKIGSPLGKILQNKKLKNWIWKLPQYCIAEGSKVLMSDFSTKNIEDVKIGDKIFTVTEKKPHRLKMAIVENTMFNGEREVIELSNGINSLYLTSDHKMLTKISPMYRNWKSWDELDSNNHEVYYFRNYIKNMNDYYRGVFLGFLETEGSFKRNKIEKSIGQKTEKKALRWLLNRLNIEYTEYDDKTIEDFSYFYLKTKNNPYIDKIYNDLEDNKDIQLGFLAGCVYGDGCVHYNPETKHRDVTLKQKNKCEIIEKIINLANIKHSKRKCIQDTKYGVFNGYSYNFNMYEIPLCLPHAKKSIIYQKMIEDRSLMGIQHKKVFVKTKSIKKVYDLTTSLGSFVANGFLVHNCREDWTEEIENEKAEQYGGKSSPGYRLNVLAETIEGAFGFYDMARLKEMSVKKTGIVKSFEINKENFNKFEEFLIIDKLPGTIKTYLCADIGLGAAPTEIAIIFFDGKKYKYIYNISLYRLIQDEQATVFEWLYKKLGGAFVAIDASGDGGVIIDELKKREINEKHLLKVKFQENIETGFQEDDDGNVLYDNDGNPLMVKENTMDFAMKQLAQLMYSGKMEIPPDPKFLTEFTNIIAKQSKLKTLYSSKGPDHLHQSFQVFAVCEWFTENNFADEYQQSERCWGVM